MSHIDTILHRAKQNPSQEAVLHDYDDFQLLEVHDYNNEDEVDFWKIYSTVSTVAHYEIKLDVFDDEIYINVFQNGVNLIEDNLTLAANVDELAREFTERFVKSVKDINVSRREVVVEWI